MAKIKLGQNVVRCCLNVAGRGPEKKQASLCLDNVAGGRGWHSRETQLKESKCEEGHVALG
jgi:hypothetical protein